MNRKLMISLLLRLSIIILVFTMLGVTARAQETGEIIAGTARAPAWTFWRPSYTAEPPVLTDEQKAQWDYWTEITPLPGPPLDRDRIDPNIRGPEGGTVSFPDGNAIKSAVPAESFLNSNVSTSAAPDDAQVFRDVDLGIVPATYASNFMESSVGVAGKFAFYTGNWFAARSTDSGNTWSYVNPWNQFPQFCCDQVVIYDESRGLLLWLRQGNWWWWGGGRFNLSVSKDGGQTWWWISVTPWAVNPNWSYYEMWDYPHMALGADYLYMAWNIYHINDLENARRTVMLRWPLDALAVPTANFSYQYVAVTDWSTFVAGSGCRRYHVLGLQHARLRPTKQPHPHLDVA